MKPRSVHLPDGRVWLRVADPDWRDPLDPSFARREGGRWNPPASYDTLYLNGDVTTARLQIDRLLAGSPVHPDDLDDDAYLLVAATLPRGQICAEAVSAPGLRALDLPPGYPLDDEGNPLPREVCQQIGADVQGMGLRGVWAISAAGPDGEGRELAWFPATSRSRARAVWNAPLPLGGWRYAAEWADIGLEDQAEPRRVPT